MNILIYHPLTLERKKQDTSMDDIIYNSGYSGTETAVFEISKHLINFGHKVTIIGPTYNVKNIEGLIILPANDIIINSISIDEYDLFSPLFYTWDQNVHKIIRKIMINKKTTIWLWFHCFIDIEVIQELKNAGLKVFCQYLNSYCKNLYNHNGLHNDNCIVGNGINEIFTGPLERSELKKGRWIFHSTYSRGGEMCKRIFERMKKENPEHVKELHYASYYTKDNDKLESYNNYNKDGITWHGSLSKIELRAWLDKSDYFVYMLINEKGKMHMDTYACCVLEAMARGVIVISWNNGSLKEIYGDKIILLEPPHTDDNRLIEDGIININLLNNSEYDRKVIDKILEIDSNPKYKEELRIRAYEWAQKQLWKTRAKELERELIKVLINE